MTEKLDPRDWHLAGIGEPPAGLTMKEAAEWLSLQIKLREEGKFKFFNPSPKQIEFFDLGMGNRERLLRAGNQLGKSEAGAFETACHMTGEYPDDWMGRRFTHAPRGWLAGVSSKDVRDIQQVKLCGAFGNPEALGTGMIPKDRFAKKPSLGRGVTDGFDTIFVKHTSGGVSTASFKSYEQGRENFQGEPVDFIWADEEPPMDIYSEMLTRTTATRGMIYVTFTPLKGMTELLRRFRERAPSRAEVLMTIRDATHYTAEEREEIIARYPAHEREARANGAPMLGSGAVFEEVTQESLRVPLLVAGNEIIHTKIGPIMTGSWAKLWGIDFGIGHPFAATLLAWDRDNDCIYVLAEVKIPGGIPAIHASRMKAIAANVPVAWPHDGNARDKGSGEQLAGFYKKEGLLMLPGHATFEGGGYGTEAGVMEMLGRMRKGQFKVAEGCTEWYNEFSSYYRKDGLIVKEFDDLLSATRVGVMQIRSGRAVPLGGKYRSKGTVLQPGHDAWGS